MKKIAFHQILLGILAFSLGLLLGYFGQKFFHKYQAPEFHLNRLYQEGGHLVNPLMQVEGPSGHDLKLEIAKNEMESVVEKALKDQTAESVSVYLRNLNKGTWVGIQEDEKYIAASLAKVPLMFALLLKIQRDPESLSKRIVYEKPIENPFHQNIPPKDQLVLGNSYTVEELLRNMMDYSDNISKDLLIENHYIDEEWANRIYKDLRLPTLRDNSEYYISPKDFARYFRLLYSATYLNQDASEKALKILTEVDFKEGIVAGLPENVTVAHKFGERGDQIGRFQLHDCGIVYASPDPYAICVMTKGWKMERLKEIIKDLSAIAYKNSTSPAKA